MTCRPSLAIILFIALGSACGRVTPLSPVRRYTVDSGKDKRQQELKNVEVMHRDGKLFLWAKATPTQFVAELDRPCPLCFTQVWEGDFDSNGTPDALVLATDLNRASCRNQTTVTAFMTSGQSGFSNWSSQTDLARDDQSILLVDANHNGYAELIATECEVTPAGEQHRITAVYEAEAESWHKLKDADLEFYLDFARQAGQQNVTWTAEPNTPAN